MLIKTQIPCALMKLNGGRTNRFESMLVKMNLKLLPPRRVLANIQAEMPSALSSRPTSLASGLFAPPQGHLPLFCHTLSGAAPTVSKT